MKTLDFTAKNDQRKFERQSLLVDLEQLFLDGEMDEDTFLEQVEWFATSEEYLSIKEWWQKEKGRIVMYLVECFKSEKIGHWQFLRTIKKLISEDDYLKAERWASNVELQKAS